MPTPTKGPRLGGGPAHEKAIIANLARALFEHGRITTTLTKAKRLRPRAEHLITFAKKGDLASRRQVLRVVRDRDVVYKLFDEIAPRFADRQGGYTRILKLGPRHGDNAPMAMIELVEQEPAAPEATAATDDADATPRRRFGRRREAQEAPAGSNRAQRRAAARGKLAPAPEHAHEGEGEGEEEEEEAAATADAVAAEEDELPDVPTDEELAAGATPVVDEADAAGDADEAETGPGDGDVADAEAEAARDDEEPEDGAKKP